MKWITLMKKEMQDSDSEDMENDAAEDKQENFIVINEPSVNPIKVKMIERIEVWN